MTQKLRDSVVITKTDIMTGKNTTFMTSEIFHKMNIFFTNDVPTAGTDGKDIFIGVKFWENLSKEQKIRVLVHEAEHRMFQHNIREIKKISHRFNNIAMDIPIEAINTVCGIGAKIPGTIGEEIDCYGTCTLTINGVKIIIEEAHKKSYEEVLRILMKHVNDNPGTGEGQSMFEDGQNGEEGEGTGTPVPGKGKGKGKGPSVKGKSGKELNPVDDFTPGQISEEEGQEIRSRLRASLTENKTRGNMHGTFAEILEGLLKQKVDWKIYFRNIVEPQIKAWASFSKRSRRSLPDQIFPGMYKEGVNLSIALDTSGSMTPQELNLCYSELQHIFRSFAAGSVNATIILHTCEVYSTFELTNSSKVPPFKTMSGGTSHLDVFKVAEKSKAEILVCFTDGESEFPSHTKLRNVLWIVTNKKSMERIPGNLGRRIFVDPEDL